MQKNDDDKDETTNRRKWPVRGIERPNEHDVLNGRGGLANNFLGNIAYRQLVEQRKQEYVQSTKRSRKTAISRELVQQWRSLEPPGRFLEKDEKSNLWNEIGDKKARRKTSQLLREGASIIKEQINAEQAISTERQNESSDSEADSSYQANLKAPPITSRPTASTQTKRHPTLSCNNKQQASQKQEQQGFQRFDPEPWREGQCLYPDPRLTINGVAYVQPNQYPAKHSNGSYNDSEVVIPSTFQEHVSTNLESHISIVPRHSHEKVGPVSWDDKEKNSHGEHHDQTLPLRSDFHEVAARCPQPTEMSGRHPQAESTLASEILRDLGDIGGDDEFNLFGASGVELEPLMEPVDGACYGVMHDDDNSTTRGFMDLDDDDPNDA